MITMGGRWCNENGVVWTNTLRTGEVSVSMEFINFSMVRSGAFRTCSKEVQYHQIQQVRQSFDRHLGLLACIDIVKRRSYIYTRVRWHISVWLMGSGAEPYILPDIGWITANNRPQSCLGRFRRSLSITDSHGAHNASDEGGLAWTKSGS